MGISAHVAPKEAMMNRWVGVLWADVGWEHLGMSMKVTKTTSGETPFTVCRERRETWTRSLKNTNIYGTDDISLN